MPLPSRGTSILSVLSRHWLGWGQLQLLHSLVCKEETRVTGTQCYGHSNLASTFCLSHPFFLLKSLLQPHPRLCSAPTNTEHLTLQAPERGQGRTCDRCLRLWAQAGRKKGLEWGSCKTKEDNLDTGLRQGLG